jgi:hypothetical protein
MLIAGLAIALLIGVVSAAVIQHFGQVKMTATVNQAVLLDGKDYTQMPITETVDVAGGQVLYRGHWLQSQTSVPVTVVFETTYSPDLTDNEIVTEILEIFDEAYPASYTPPTSYDIRVPEDYRTISAAITAASSGQVIGVAMGTYNEEVTIDKGITLASLDGPSYATITGGIWITASNVKVTGFTINPRTVLGEMSCIYLAPVLSNIEISFNDLNRGSVTDRAVGVLLGVYGGGASYSNVKITNNKIHDLTTGIYMNPHDGIVAINHNEIYNNEAGVGGATGATIEYNTFHNNYNSWSGWYEAIGADDTATSLMIQYNNFLGDDSVAMYGDGWITAYNNWWDFDGIDIHGNVNASYMIKDDFILQPYEIDWFCIRYKFAVDIYPYTYTITTTVKPAP